jgi:hypothetical protein
MGLLSRLLVQSSLPKPPSDEELQVQAILDRIRADNEHTNREREANDAFYPQLNQRIQNPFAGWRDYMASDPKGSSYGR